MRKHRFFVTNNLTVDQILTVDEDISHQIARVLRLQINDHIFLFNNSGFEYNARIAKLDRNAVTVVVTNVTEQSFESPCQIHLGQVLGKGEKMDLVIQKATELGVTSITPL